MLIACADSDVRLLQCNVNECCVLVSRLRKVLQLYMGRDWICWMQLSVCHSLSFGIQDKDEHTHGER